MPKSVVLILGKGGNVRFVCGIWGKEMMMLGIGRRKEVRG